MNVSLSERLIICASMIAEGSRVADVGCDHGYLGIYLIYKNIASYVVETDLRSAPLANAKGNFEKYGIISGVRFVCASGLDGIVPEEIDTVVCAGMGSDCIIGILNNAGWLKNPLYTLILQPQSSFGELRSYLYRNGFTIVDEIITEEKGFLYTVIKARYSGCVKPETPASYYVSDALLKHTTPEYRKYLERTEHNLKLSIRQLALSKKERSDKLRFFEIGLNEILKLEDIYDTQQ